MTMPSVAEYRKGLAALGGLLVTLLSLGVLHGDVEKYVILAVSILASFGVIVLPNKPQVQAAQPDAPPKPPLV